MMIDRAIGKITAEMMECNSSFARFIEEYLTSICVTTRVAEKLLDPKKNLKEFVELITKEYEEKARKQGTGGQAVGDADQVFFEAVEAYYNITEEDKAPVRKSDTIDIRDLL